MLILLSPMVLVYQPAHAIPTLVQGLGTASPPLADSGDFWCSSHHGPVDLVTYELYFIASVNGKSLSGVWAIGQLNEDMGDFLTVEEHGIINGGTIGPGVFNLTGTETFDNICSHRPVSSIMNINGHIPSDCTPLGNRSSVAQFKDTKGETGSFLTQVRCNQSK
jgi:hypothetical protein